MYSKKCISIQKKYAWNVLEGVDITEKWQMSVWIVLHF